MKKIYAFVFALMCGLGFATTAQAQEKGSVILDVDVASRLKIKNVNGDEIAIKDGENTYEFDLSTDDYLQVEVTSGDYGLVSAAAYRPNGVGGFEHERDEYIWDNKVQLNVSSFTNGYKWEFTTMSYAELRTAQCTIVIDDPSNVQVQRDNYSMIEGLKAGENIVKFIPEGEYQETPFTISSIKYEQPLYQVLLNGTPIQKEYTSFVVKDLKDGDKIEIFANYPDEDVLVKFVPADEASKGFINQVKVGDREISADQWEEGFNVKLGTNLQFHTDMSFYNPGKIYVNQGKEDEEELWPSDMMNYFVGTTGEKVITYQATQRATYEITVNVDHADRIRLYKNNAYSESNLIDLVDGENKVRIPENVMNILLKVQPGCWLESFTNQKGETLQADINVYINAGDVFTITTGQVERNEQIVFYIDEPSMAPYGGAITFACDRADRTTALGFQDQDGNFIEGGYYVLPFSSSFDNLVQVVAYTDPGQTYYLYHNDKEIPVSSSLTLADKDIVKLYLENKPETFTVTFAQAEGISAQATDVIRDRVVEVTDLTTPLSVLTGTEVQFRLSAEAVVTANGVALTPVDGLYTATITANTEILVGGEPTALENVDAALQHNVYNIQGMLLLQNATQAQINVLPAGIYIINGKTTYLWQK